MSYDYGGYGQQQPQQQVIDDIVLSISILFLDLMHAITYKLHLPMTIKLDQNHGQKASILTARHIM